MSFMSRLPRPKALSPTDDAYYFPGGAFWGGYAPSSSGIAVGTDSAMRQMTVHNCVKVLFNCISQMPCQLMQEVGDVKSKAKDFYLYEIIGKRPNHWMTAPQFWGMAVVHVSLRGNFYAYKTRIGRKVVSLLPIHPDKVNVKQNEDWSLTYEMIGSDRKYTQDEIFHIRGLSLDGFTGLNPIEYARECIGLGLAGEQFIARYFGKGMHPGAIVEHPATLSAQAHANLREALKQKYAGLNNAQDLMLIDEGMKIQFPPIKLVDQQFLEQMKFTESQICGMFGVPLMMVQSGDNQTTYASASEFKRTFVDLTLTPICVNFETAIDRSLLNDDEQKRYYTKFNLNSLLRGNITERFNAYRTAIESKIMNANEIRALEDLNKREGGDVYENPNIQVTPPKTAGGKEDESQLSQ